MKAHSFEHEMDVAPEATEQRLTSAEAATETKPKAEKAPLFLTEWLPKQSKHYLTAKTIRHLKKGEALDLVIFDRNIGDSLNNAVSAGKLKLNRSYTLHTLLKKIDHIGRFHHDTKLQGRLQFHGINIDTFTFDELKKREKRWTPVGSNSSPKAKTILGYRGHAIPLNAIDKHIKVRVKQDNEGNFL